MKTVSQHFKLTEDEQEILREKAKAMGLTVSAYIRLMCIYS